MDARVFIYQNSEGKLLFSNFFHIKCDYHELRNAFSSATFEKISPIYPMTEVWTIVDTDGKEATIFYSRKE